MTSSQGGVSEPYVTNEEKPLTVEVNGRRYMRLLIRTHFITPEDSYRQVLEEYVQSHCQKGDILVMSEKIVAIMQNRVVYKEDMHLSWLARVLSGFVTVNPAGRGIRNPYKMQMAIDRVGVFRILLGALAAAVTKPFGIRGVFYRVVGNNVWALDGFTDLAYDYYLDKGILAPKDPDEVCSEVQDKLGLPAVIVDANDLGVEVLGKSDGVKLDANTISRILYDNPAGQTDEQTPLLLIRTAEG